MRVCVCVCMCEEQWLLFVSQLEHHIHEFRTSQDRLAEVREKYKQGSSSVNDLARELAQVSHTPSHPTHLHIPHTFTHHTPSHTTHLHTPHTFTLMLLMVTPCR